MIYSLQTIKQLINPIYLCCRRDLRPDCHKDMEMGSKQPTLATPLKPPRATERAQKSCGNTRVIILHQN